MTESTEVRTRTYRGIEFQLWRSGDRWFAFAPGQDCLDHGHRTLSRALEYAEDFIDSQREILAGQSNADKPGTTAQNGHTDY